MTDQLSTISDREKRQTHSIEDVGRVRSFMKNSTTIKLFARVSRQAGSELELCRDKILREFLLRGGKSSDDLDTAIEVTKMFIDIFTDCEETIYEEEKKDEASDGEDDE